MVKSAGASANAQDAVAGPPQALPVIFENIPAELRDHGQWALWRYERRNGKWTKPPFCARTGLAASSTDPTTWASLGDVRAAYEAGGWDGIGFIHLPQNHLTGLDWDHCRDPYSGAIPGGPAREIEMMDTYAEVSPSGTGVRAYAFGQKPSRRCKIGPFEMYDGLTAKYEPGGRFLTVTGHRLPGGPETINSRQAQIERLYNERFGKPPEDTSRRPVPEALESASATTRRRMACADRLRPCSRRRPHP